MGGIRIVNPGKKIKNEYTARFANYSVQELVEEFNSDQPKQGWVNARGRFLSALRQAFLRTDIDCTSFISEDGMSLNFPIRREGKIIIQVKENQ